MYPSFDGELVRRSFFLPPVGSVRGRMIPAFDHCPRGVGDSGVELWGGGTSAREGLCWRCC